MDSNQQPGEPAINLPVDGVTLFVPQSDGLSGFNINIRAVGASIHIPELAIHIFYADDDITSKLNLPNKVAAIFIKKTDLWYLAFDKPRQQVTFGSVDDPNKLYLISFSDSEAVLNDGNQVLHQIPLTEFESGDDAKLRLLYQALQKEYGEDRISLSCIVPINKSVKLPMLSNPCDKPPCVFSDPDCKNRKDCKNCSWKEGGICK